MRTWIIISVVVGLFVFGAIALITNAQSIQASEDASGSCPYGSTGCPYKEAGGCSQGSNCGLDTCAAKYGGGCGCGK